MYPSLGPTKNSKKGEGKKRTRKEETQKGESISQREDETYRSEEELLEQAFYAEKRRKFDWTLDQIQGICARTLRCKSKVADQFEWVFIPPIKVTARFFTPITTGEIPIVGLPSRRPMWGAQSCQNLMKTRSVYRSARNMSWANKKALTLTEDKT